MVFRIAVGPLRGNRFSAFGRFWNLLAPVAVCAHDVRGLQAAVGLSAADHRQCAVTAECPGTSCSLADRRNTLSVLVELVLVN